MKVAFIAPDASTIRSDAFFNALRSIVGTTEFFISNPQNDKQLKGLIASKNWDERFDRVVFMLDPQMLFEQRQAIKSCTHPVFLGLDGNKKPQPDAIIKLLRGVPWMRWMGIDLSLSQDLNRKGFDAYPVKPINPVTLISHTNEPQAHPIIYIDNKAKKISSEQMIKETSLETFMLNDAKKNETFKCIKRGDIFLSWYDGKCYDPLPMIKAMARGAVVITLNPGRDTCFFYGWQDGHNCIIVDSLKNIHETIHILLKNKDVSAAISLAAIETASHYSQQAIGREIGMGLLLPMRQKSDYQQKMNLLRLRF